jgi:hypothetical protein
MIECASYPRNVAVASKQREMEFESLLPVVRRCAAYAFRRIRRCLREDLIAEAVANAYAAFARLIKRGLAHLVYPTALARFAIRKVWDGRRIGARRSASDVMSEYAQVKRKFAIEQLDHASLRQPWEELLTDRRATPADLAACKLDFCAWLMRLSQANRKVALRLAMGDTTKEAANRFSISASRISQIRRELQNDWYGYHGEPVPQL